MHTQRGLWNGLALFSLAALAITGWMRSTPAAAQQEAPPPLPTQGVQARPMRPFMMGPTSLAAGGNFVYVLRGNTLYQMRADDLSVVTTKELPAPAGQGGPPPGNGLP